MATLPEAQRRNLERTIVTARRQAEGAARAALERLAVGRAQPFVELTPEERELRVGLRAHGRQLGDRRTSAGEQEISKLAAECAYEQWHRMLFARFLAENDFLLHPEHGVPVSLAECDEFATEAGEPNGWVVAGQFAARMLPGIFRPESTVLRVRFAPEHQQELERLLGDLPTEVFQADDSLGWVYQFWQSERKDEVNRSGKKIGAEELPAVTQLFTEHYMVLFLLHNTVGAWWAGKVLASRPELAERAESEEELRQACSLKGYSWDYLRFVRDPDTGNAWRPAAGTYPGWPKRAAEITYLDPCCGSGHFLSAALELFCALREEEEGLSREVAVRRVLSETVNGLELDPRCTQIAAFSLAFAAWRRLGKPAPLPRLRVACCGLAVGVPKADWLALAEDDEDLRRGLERLFGAFAQAPTLGSLIDPQRDASQDLFSATLEKLETRLVAALEKGGPSRSHSADENVVVASGLAHAALTLLSRYTLAATNVPYLARKGHDAVLAAFADQRFSEAKADLATIFIARMLDLVSEGGSIAVVSPQNWQFLTTYTRFRTSLLKDHSWGVNARLGNGAFETIGGEVVNVALLAMSRRRPEPSQVFFALDASQTPAPSEKAAVLRGQRPPADPEAFIGLLRQQAQLRNPDSRLVFSTVPPGDLLSKLANSYQGLSPADLDRFGRQFWEIDFGPVWQPWRGAVDTTREHSGCSRAVRCDAEFDEAVRQGSAYLRGREAWGRRGISVSQMSSLPVSLYGGERFDTNVAVIVPNRERDLPAIWCFCSSPEFTRAVRRIDQKLNVTNATMVKVPFDLPRWERISRERYPDGLPEPESDDPTQWLFHGHPSSTTLPAQVAVARLVGYRWPPELDKKMRLSKEARTWVERCEELLPLADPDGVVCLQPVHGEQPAGERLREMLAKAFGKEWRPAKLADLLAGVGYAGKSLDQWLRDGFFEQHCQVFHQRPFVWQIWDGRKDGFSALLNYHRLDRKLLERVTYTYLGDWITQQKSEVKALSRGAEDRLAAAEDLQRRLGAILEGEAPYDIFVRWKPIEKQPQGWDPDLDDGVRLNIRPFVEAGVLRKTPKIKWGIDRGKNPAEAPWGEVRDNDRHLTLAEKRMARERTRARR